jgi:hypothetical protein
MPAGRILHLRNKCTAPVLQALTTSSPPGKVARQYPADRPPDWRQIARIPTGRSATTLVQGAVERMAVEALADTRVVVVNGARQVGKSTLAELIVARSPLPLP